MILSGGPRKKRKRNKAGIWENNLSSTIYLKIIVLLILAVLLLALLILQGMAPAVPVESEQGDVHTEDDAADAVFDAPSLPDYPNTKIELTHDAVAGGLIDMDDVLRFRLDESGENWVPVLPEELEKDIPDGYTLGKDDFGAWIIKDANGRILYMLNIDSLEWQAIEEQTESTVDANPEKEIISCAGANPVRISGVGARVQVVNALIPLRSSPDATNSNYVKSLPEGALLEIISEPVCTPYLDGANQWWGVRTEDGVEGFAAEGSAASDLYYLKAID